MKVSVTTIGLQELDVDLLLLPIAEDALEGVSELVFGADSGSAAAAADFGGRKDETLVIYPEGFGAKRIALQGLGPSEDVSLEALRKVGAEGAALAARFKVDTAAVAMPDLHVSTESAAQATVEGFVLGGYRFDRYKTSDKESAHIVQRLVVHAATNDKAARRGAERGRIVSEAVCTTRDLVNISPHDKTATLLAREFEKLAKKYGFSASVWDKSLIEEEGMRGLLAVNMGSIEPPTFTVLEWAPESAVNTRPIVLVGKGVVFDTGGLSLKGTKDSMDAMKSDMAGAAAVAGVFEAIARLDLPLYVVGLIPATDNRPGEAAYVPGDVIRMHSGTTVEVLNTDAEGRLILADALSYARTYKPELVIDVATLTGAAIVALGTVVAAVMTSNADGADDSIAALTEAGQRSGDPVHQMPMHDHYATLLKSDVADLKNVGGREAGSITAAKFLERFIDYPWIHIDIAGPSYLRVARAYHPVGGTGFGVRLLVEFLRNYVTRAQK